MKKETLIVEISYDPNIPYPNNVYTASIMDSFIVVTGASVSECFQELSVSLKVMENIHKPLKNKTGYL